MITAPNGVKRTPIRDSVKLQKSLYKIGRLHWKRLKGSSKTLVRSYVQWICCQLLAYPSDWNETQFLTTK